MKILSSFTLIDTLYDSQRNTKLSIQWKPTGFSVISDSFDFHCMDKTVLQNIFFCVLQKKVKPRSDCWSKSNFYAYPIEIWSDLASVNGKKKKRFLQICFELHSHVVWNPIQIAFLEIRFSLTALIRFCVVYVTFSRHVIHQMLL